MRNTKQKELILSIINNSTEHLSADEVYDKAQKEISNISLGTIYRVLNSLVDQGKAIIIKSNDGVNHYDNTIRKHSHFICDECYKIIDVFDSINISHHILPDCKLLNCEIIFHGICQNCLRKER